MISNTDKIPSETIIDCAYDIAEDSDGGKEDNSDDE